MYLVYPIVTVVNDQAAGCTERKNSVYLPNYWELLNPEKFGTSPDNFGDFTEVFGDFTEVFGSFKNNVIFPRTLR